MKTAEIYIIFFNFTQKLPMQIQCLKENEPLRNEIYTNIMKFK